MLEQRDPLAPPTFGMLLRRLRGLAMISRGIVPNLLISQQVVDRIVRAARSYLADETGETMVGLVLAADESEDAMPTLVVLDTIAPDESSIRRTHMFEQGDDLQGDIFVWLYENWESGLQMRRDSAGRPIASRYAVPLRHLGDWHKQPGYMIQPSGGDLMTALNIMDDEENDFEFLLVPIVTLGHPSVTSEEGATVNYFTIPMEDGTSLRMDWWYIHCDVRVFQPITPRIQPADSFPSLFPYPWHVLDRDLLDEEVDLLQDDGLFLIGSTSILWEVDGTLPLEICFILGRAGSSDVFLVVTDWDYPKRQPRVFRAPFKDINPAMYIYDIFGQLWDHASQIGAPPDFVWNPQSTYIVDYIEAIENHLGIRPAAIQPIPRAVQISVELDDDDASSPAPPTDDVMDEEEDD